MRRPSGGYGGPMIVSSRCMSIACIAIVAVIYIAIAMYNNFCYDSSERIKYSKELEELREIVKRHQDSSTESEELLKSLFQAHKMIPSHERAIKEREGKDQILDSNITQLKFTYSDLTKKIKNLEELIQDLDSKDKEHHIEFHSQNNNNLRREGKLYEKSKIIDELLESLSSSESDSFGSDSSEMLHRSSLNRNEAKASAAEEHFKVEVPKGIQDTKVDSKKHSVDVQDTSHSSLRTVSSLLGENTVLLIIASNRPQYLSKTLSYVIKYHPLDSIPIVIAEDGSSPAVDQVVEEMKKKFSEQKSRTVPFIHIKNTANQHQYFENGYWKLCAHFKWALSEVFGNRLLKSIKNNDFVNVRRVILLEEDLQIAPDFFEYFAATSELLDKDSTLMAISAFNDNGQGVRVKDNKALYRCAVILENINNVCESLCVFSYCIYPNEPISFLPLYIFLYIYLYLYIYIYHKGRTSFRVWVG